MSRPKKKQDQVRERTTMDHPIWAKPDKVANLSLKGQGEVNDFGGQEWENEL